ncbi:MAG: tetratricopeptide repeat protein [Candidatus Aegiribacteria sp.]|nr:tetratricopeptide repeat protein [Candidatus Aegiribacteria sp.]MBD3294764.1 tetratricopeptide repeat protein [Candidatus Fermentibacteria bacterium]
MRNVVPRLIKALCPEPSGSGDIYGAALFVDIKGFTKVTEELMDMGRKGAERVSGIINSVYRPSLKRVYDLDGSVVSFIGDSFVAVFPQDCFSRLPVLCDYLHEKIPPRLEKAVATSAGVRTGVAKGKMKWGVVSSSGVSSWYLRGDAVEKACSAAYGATELAVEEIQNSSMLTVPRGLSGIRLGSRFSRRFVPENIVSMDFRGEFRTAAPLFMSFDPEVSDDELKLISGTALKLAVRYGGYFGGVFFDEKGGSILVAFGVPRSRERAMERALLFAISAMHTLSDYISIGISYGRVYAGFVGSRKRNSYTVLGDEVNTAARLCFTGSRGEILVTDKLADRLSQMGFSYKDSGCLWLKGRQKPVRSITVDSPHKSTIKSSGPLLGRDQELAALKELALQSFDETEKTPVLVKGPPGIGKTRLISKLEESVAEKCCVLKMEAYEMDFSSIAPLGRLMGRVLGIRPESIHREIMQSRWTDLKKDCEWSIHPSEENLIRSMVEWLLGYGSPPEAGTKPGRIAQEVQLLLKNWSGRKRVLVVAEDAQWMDDIVLRVLEALQRHEGIAVVLTARKCPASFPSEKVIQLEPLSRSEILSLLESTGAAVLETETVDLVMNRSRGNPFMALQYFDLLKETGLAEQAGETAGRSHTCSIPDEILEVLTARIDRTEDNLRKGILSISVLGNRFTLPVFRSILGDDSETILRDGIEAEVWESAENGAYLFSHDLLRQAACSIPLGKDLKKLHYEAFRALEKVYPDEPNHARDKAVHLERSARTARAADFYSKAGDFNSNRYLNSEALENYRAVERCLPESDVDGRLDARGKQGSRLEAIGEWEEAIRLYRDSISLAQETEQEHHRARLMLSLGKLQLMKGLLKEGRISLEGALEVFRRLNDEDMVSRVYANMSLYHYHAGEYTEAEKYAEMFLNTSVRIENRTHESMALGMLSVFTEKRGELERSLEISRRQLQLADDLGLVECQSDAYSNMGSVYIRRGELEKAKQCYLQNMEVVQESGLYSEKISAITMLANVDYLNGKLQEAASKYERALMMAKRVEDSYSEADILFRTARVLKGQHSEAKARSAAERAVELVNEFGYGDLRNTHHDLMEEYS